MGILDGWELEARVVGGIETKKEGNRKREREREKEREGESKLVCGWEK